MVVRTLVDFLPLMERLGKKEAIRFFNGFRTWTFSYDQLFGRLSAFAAFLSERRIEKGARLLLWGCNGPEWVICFWGAAARGVQIIPLDPGSSPELVSRIAKRTSPSLLVFSEGLETDFLDLPRISFSEIGDLKVPSTLPAIEVEPDDIAEIVFTSGTTGEPKGVVHRHRNLCANLRPFQKEIERYLYLARPFQPIRLLSLLPLSHMFGQSLGLFIPVFLQGASVFTTDLHPASLVETIRRERISVLGTVPRVLSQLQSFLERETDTALCRIRTRGLLSVPERWWRYRGVHSALGWKFWAVVAGGAQLKPDIEEFWSRLGILLIQGYGLTEASPIVSVNHPFQARRGSIGRVVEGQEVKIAADGEILVRGESIAREYFDGGRESGGVLPADEWLHTGDIGEFDSQGNLIFKGRKKDVIVTSEGLNVFPEDVESVLAHDSNLEACTVVGLSRDGEEQVHAVLIPRRPTVEEEDGALNARIEESIRRANQKLEAHQRIKSWSIWPEADFPRTLSTLKVRRFEVAERLKKMKAESEGKPGLATATRPVGIVARMVGEIGGQDPAHLQPRLRLAEDLGLSSLDRIELLSRLERSLGLRLDESTFSSFNTVGEVVDWVEKLSSQGGLAKGERIPSAEEEAEDRSTTIYPAAAAPAAPAKGAVTVRPPRWNRSFPARIFRFTALHTVVLPIFRHYLPLTVQGIDHLAGLKGPVLFAANHSSHLDTPALLAALPNHWRSRAAPAMQQEYFQAYFAPRGEALSKRITTGFKYYLACALFNAYPLPQRMGGIRRFLQYTGELVDRGFSPIVFPEGKRTPDGRLLPFKPGVGMMATRLKIPVVPVYIRGLFEVLSLYDDWPRPGPVEVRFGPALHLGGDDYEQATRRIEQAVRELASKCLA